MTAAIFAGTCTHPIDLAKVCTLPAAAAAAAAVRARSLARSHTHAHARAQVRLQLHAVQHAKAVEAGLAQASAPKPSIFTVLSATVREGGPLAIYDGVTACWGRQAVYGTARLGCVLAVFVGSRARQRQHPPTDG